MSLDDFEISTIGKKLLLSFLNYNFNYAFRAIEITIKKLWNYHNFFIDIDSFVSSDWIYYIEFQRVTCKKED